MRSWLAATLMFMAAGGPAEAQIYQFALREWAELPKTVKEGTFEIRTGIGSFGARRSVAGFRSFISEGGISL